MVGDAWGSETVSDPSILSLDYYRQKATEFQVALNSLDEVGRALYIAERAASCEAAMADEWSDLIGMFQTKRNQFVLAADAINLAGNTLNSAGVRFPVLSYGANLGALPALALPAVAVAVAAAASLIVFGKEFAATVRDALKRWQYSDAFEQLTPEEKADMLRDLIEADARVTTAQTTSGAGSLESIAGAVKWVAIGVGIFAVFRMYKDSQRG